MPAAVFCQLSSIHSIVSVIVNAYIAKDERGFKTKHEGFLPSPIMTMHYVLKVKQDHSVNSVQTSEHISI